MHRRTVVAISPLSLLALLSLLPAREAGAQSRASLAADDRARKAACESQSYPRVTIVAAADAPVAFVDAAGASIAFWLRGPFGAGGRTAEYAVRLDGTRRAEIDDVASSDSAALGAGRAAIEVAVGEGALDGLQPAAGGGPVTVRVLIGRAPDGRAAATQRRVCYAVPRGDNPPLLFPPELRPGMSDALPDPTTKGSLSEGTVRARFRVDSAGDVVPGSVTVLAATHPAFGRAVELALPSLHFYPATIDGRPLAQVVEQEFAFSLTFRPGARRTAG